VPSTTRYSLTARAFGGTPATVAISVGLSPVTTTFGVTYPVRGELIPVIVRRAKQRVSRRVYSISGPVAGSGYPAPGDVELNVIYGSASEYTGNFYAPATTNVKSGVGYGNAGTELTGSYGGGGGGATRPIGSPIVRRIQ
jgi:hypothetical protein